MVTIHENSSGNVLGVKASGKLTHADYRQLLPKLETLIRTYGTIRVLFELEDCQGWSLVAAWDDLRFAFQHGRDCERCAVVGDKKWQQRLAQFSKPFFKVKYFDKTQRDQAWQWVLKGGIASAVSA